MECHRIDALTKYVGLCELMPLCSAVVLFRGQPVHRGLLPSVARVAPTKDTTKNERESLRQIRLLGAQLLPATDLTDLDLMVLAQHFGHRTRLLDWTTNPLAALWFACSSKENGDGYVYILEGHSLLEVDVYESDPFLLPEVVAFQPRNSNSRVNAQHGWFTLHQYSPRSSRFDALDEIPQLSVNLQEITIPSDARLSILQSLDLMGINARTLFPDLSGLSQYLHWRTYET